MIQALRFLDFHLYDACCSKVSELAMLHLGLYRRNGYQCLFNNSPEKLDLVPIMLQRLRAAYRSCSCFSCIRRIQYLSCDGVLSLF